MVPRTSRLLAQAALSLAVALPAGAGPPAEPAPQALSDAERAMVEWIDRHQDQALAFLARIVDLESGTANAAGVRVEVASLAASAKRAAVLMARLLRAPP